MSEEVLQIAKKRREVKGKGEKERYTHLNAEFQRITRRDKKGFLSDLCKKIEEPSTCAGDLREILRLPLRSQGYCGVGKDLSGLHWVW